MSAAAVVEVKGNSVSWYCPGCKYPHRIETGPRGWTWNGRLDKPTFAPSVLSTTRGEQPARCHCYVRDGQIQFLNDCTHEFAGKTVPVPTLPEWMQ